MASGVRTRTAVGRLPALSVPIAPSLDSVFKFQFTGAAPSAARLCPEIDCLRGQFPDGVLAEAEQRAFAIGVSADRVLIAAGTIGEEAYLRTLAGSLGVAFDALDGVPRAQCPIDDNRLIEAAAAGMLPLRVGGELSLVVAPRGVAVRKIIALIGGRPELARRIRFTSSERLTAFVFRHGSRALAERATNELAMRRPDLSAAPPRWRGNTVWLAAAAACAALAALAMAPVQAELAAQIALSGLFLAWLGLRLAGAFIVWPAPAPRTGLRDDELPVYTLISALYREAASVDGLLAAIEALDYPGIMAQTPQALNPLPA